MIPVLGWMSFPTETFEHLLELYRQEREPESRAATLLEAALAGRRVNKASLCQAIQRLQTNDFLPDVGRVVLTAILTTPIGLLGPIGQIIHQGLGLLHLLEASVILDDVKEGSAEAKGAAEDVRKSRQQVNDAIDEAKNAKKNGNKADTKQAKKKLEDANAKLKKAVNKLIDALEH